MVFCGNLSKNFCMRKNICNGIFIGCMVVFIKFAKLNFFSKKLTFTSFLSFMDIKVNWKNIFLRNMVEVNMLMTLFRKYRTKGMGFVYSSPSVTYELFKDYRQPFKKI